MRVGNVPCMEHLFAPTAHPPQASFDYGAARLRSGDNGWELRSGRRCATHASRTRRASATDLLLVVFDRLGGAEVGGAGVLAGVAAGAALA
jgi:hypothetical protein